MDLVRICVECESLIAVVAVNLISLASLMAGAFRRRHRSGRLGPECEFAGGYEPDAV
jgi:hypothetical protein